MTQITETLKVMLKQGLIVKDEHGRYVITQKGEKCLGIHKAAANN